MNNHHNAGNETPDIAGLAHDMRSPLSVIKSFLEIVSVQDEEEIEFCDAAMRSLKKLMGLAESMRSIKKRRVNSERDIAVSIRTTVEDISIISKAKGVGIKYSGPESFFSSLGVAEIERVVQNLVTNAVQACCIGGEVRVKLSVSDDLVCLEVADDGCGIDDAHLPLIFERGFTHGKADGTGIGLDVCKKIVEDHGGKIEVKSKKGEGTVFTLSIPAARKENDATIGMNFACFTAHQNRKISRPCMACEREDTFE